MLVRQAAIPRGPCRAALVVTLVVAFGCTTPATERQEDPRHRAVASYFDLASRVDESVAARLAEAEFRASVRRLFGATFAPPILTRLNTWLDGVSLTGTQVSEFVEGIRTIGATTRPTFQVTAAGGSEATVEVRALTRYSLGFDMSDVSSLFRTYPIRNWTQLQLQAAIAADPDPEGLLFEVAARKSLTMTLVQSEGLWRIADIRERVLEATLELKRGTGPPESTPR